jgi:hypothetical protein
MKLKRFDAVQASRIMRMVAIAWSIASIVFVLLFLVGEGFNPAQVRMLQTWALLALFPFGVLLGLVLAWRWPGTGGGLATGSLLAFYAAHRLITGHFPGGPWFALISAPGPLFLLSGLSGEIRPKTVPYTNTQPWRSEND